MVRAVTMIVTDPGLTPGTVTSELYGSLFSLVQSARLSSIKTYTPNHPTESRYSMENLSSN